MAWTSAAQSNLQTSPRQAFGSNRRSDTCIWRFGRITTRGLSEGCDSNDLIKTRGEPYSLNHVAYIGTISDIAHWLQFFGLLLGAGNCAQAKRHSHCDTPKRRESYEIKIF